MKGVQVHFLSILLIFSLMGEVSLFAQETTLDLGLPTDPATENPVDPEATPVINGTKGVATDKTEDIAKDEVKDEAEEKTRNQNLEILKWGIDSQIQSLLARITEKKDTYYATAVSDFYQVRDNSIFSNNIFSYMLAIEDFSLYKQANEIIRYYEKESDATMGTLLNYSIGAANANPEIKEADLEEIIWNLYRYGNAIVGFRALEALGKLKADSYLEPLRKEYLDPSTSSAVKSHIIRTIGEIDGMDQKSWFLELLDSELPKGERWAICEVLAKLGDVSVIDELIAQFKSEDPYLRLNIIESLEGFPLEMISEFIDLGLRDSFWKVRQFSVKKCSELNLVQFIPQLIFKAETEPETLIKQETMKTLGKLQSPEGVQFLKDYFFDKKKSLGLRKMAIASLLEYPTTDYLDQLLVWAEDEKNQKSKIYPHVVGAIGDSSQKRLDPLYELLIMSKQPFAQYASVLGMQKQKIILNEPRLKELLKKNKKNYLGKAIEELFPKSNPEEDL